MREFQQILETLVGEHRGRVVKRMGDGTLIEFGSVVDAVCCAVALHKVMANRPIRVSADRPIACRIGINTGDVVVDGGDVFGDGVNVAVRLEQLCEPGGIVVSGTAYDQLQGKLDLPLDFVGERPVKNINRPVRVYTVRLDGSRAARWIRMPAARTRGLALAALLLFAALGAIWWVWSDQATLAAPPSIAVLPFENIGGDESTSRLSNGLTEDIVTDLTRFPYFEVIAPASTARFRGQLADLRRIGGDFDVRYALSGSVQRQGERLRITTQLVDVRSGAHLWSERWDRPSADFFAVQTEIAGRRPGRRQCDRGSRVRRRATVASDEPERL